MADPESFGPRIYNLEEAIAFYRQVFEIDGQLSAEVQRCIATIEKYFIEMPTDAPLPETSSAPYLGSVTVENIDETILRIEQAGGHVEIEKGEVPSRIGGWQCFVCDIAGNMFSIYQPGADN